MIFQFLSEILDWVFPPRCMACQSNLPLEDKRRRGLWLCAYCENLLQPITDAARCKTCSAPLSQDADDTDNPHSLCAENTPREVLICKSCRGKNFSFVHNTSAFAYEGMVQDLIRNMKFRGRKNIAQGLGRLWGGFILAANKKEPTADHGLQKIYQLPTDAVLVPLPLHPLKKRKRGFNQAEVLAKAIAEITGLELCLALERIRDTPPQSGLHPRQRIENVQGAFKVTSNVAGKRVVVVDDIYTTGASLEACAQALIEAGAVEVFGVTLAVVGRKEDARR